MNMKSKIAALLLMVPITAGALAGAASAAGASTADPTLGASTDHNFDWCTYHGAVNWNRATNHLDGAVSVTDNYPAGKACREKATVRFYDDENEVIGQFEAA